MAVRVNPLRKARRWFVSECIRLLTKPLKSYELRVPNNIAVLKKTLRPGDVILIEGDQRVSQVIRYLTQSSWSHSALYVGDELLKPKHGQAERVTQRYGSEARYLMIEAEVGEGVTASALRKYEHHNIRICRPQALRREDLDLVLGDVIARLGDRYDVRHIYNLARYFFPVSIVPRRWRRVALHLASGREREVICSSMIARAFARVGYPIQPRVTLAESPRPRAWWEQLLGRNGHRPRARFCHRDPALVTPRDFDLSSYFEIVKFNHLADPHFSYRDIVWEADAPNVATVEPHASRT
jgi:hypothetical protein